MNSIKINNLTFSYKTIGNEFILGPISEELPIGEFILFKGNNGSGKSTLAKILTGKLLVKNIKHFIINLPQQSFYYNQSIENNIFPELTVFEHLSLFSNNGLYTIEDLYKLFPIFNTLKNKYPDELSGGQNQLLGFCTILCKKFDLIVFDEILNHLDTEVSNQVLDLIKDELVDRRGTTVIIISHNIEILKDKCAKIICFENGKIVK